jgi:hypothetical protein
MTITLASLRTRVLNSINEAAGTPHSDVQLVEAINYAQREVGLWLNTISKTYLQKNATLVIVVGSTELWTLPSDIDMIVKLEDANKEELHEISFNEIDRDTGYYLMSGKVGIVPNITTAPTLYYVPVLPDLADAPAGAMNSLLPDNFIDLIVFLATSELNRRLNDYDAFRAAMEMYERQKLLMQPRVRRQTTRGGRVNDVRRVNG